jgi:hypothetical protein
MLSDDISCLIRSYAGSTVSDQTLDYIRQIGKFREQLAFTNVSGMRFKISTMCTCDRSCGGLFCSGVRVFSLDGNAQPEHARNGVAI